jgi:hypothetical protein
VISFQIKSLQEKHNNLKKEVKKLCDIMKELHDKESQKRGPNAADGIGEVKEETAKLKQRYVKI